MNREILSLGEGDVTLYWPAQLSPRSYRHLRAWLVGMIADKLEAASREASPDAAPRVTTARRLASRCAGKNGV
jgi:hypothetical protein